MEYDYLPFPNKETEVKRLCIIMDSNTLISTREKSGLLTSLQMSEKNKITCTVRNTGKSNLNISEVCNKALEHVEMLISVLNFRI